VEGLRQPGHGRTHRSAVAVGGTIAAQLLGAEQGALRGWGHTIRKPARVGEALPWHQDEAYWDPAFDYRALGCWLTLDPATPENGCLRFVPGSQTGGVRVHRHIGDDPSIHGPVTDDVDDGAAVAVPLPAGGAIFHHCRTLHSSARPSGVPTRTSGSSRRRGARRSSSAAGSTPAAAPGTPGASSKRARRAGTVFKC
jgi:ectoine hydroxylase-related dioxygenase (phytanoyl-CoA dioxygenase family)